ncbi:MAG: right-handed parallel beta-helix repeat-containing protein [Sneathiellales bacterium]|nr:right-handed parallel beta-helix repeat-containing protein [Sneathiellales bacterium]
MIKNFLFLIFVFLFLPSSLYAKTFFVKPSSGISFFQDGSEEKPWSDLEDALGSGDLKAGDDIVLLPGFYGALELEGLNFPFEITARSAEQGKARFSSVTLSDIRNLVLDGFSVSPSFETARAKKMLVKISRGSSKVTIRNFEVFSAPSIEGWDKIDWQAKAVSGIEASGDEIHLLNNKVYNVRFGINVLSNKSTVIGNSVINFSGDGMRGLGDYSLFEGNVIKNCFQVDKNHADGFQSWSVGKNRKVAKGVVIGNVLRGNLILNYEDEKQPFKCSMHGIGMFGGMYHDWIIENNIIVVDHWHGITVMGAKNVKIINNTVLDPTPGKPGPAWIKITKHRDKRPSKGNFVANNLATIFKSDKEGVLEVGNVRIRNPEDLFVDPENHDFRLLEGSRAIDAGMNAVGINKDFLGQKRQSGERIDAGAIEFVQ